MKKMYFIYAFVLLVSGIFIWRVASFQLLNDRYILNAYNTSIKKEITHPNRGDILDRNGKLLVSTSYSYNLDLNFNLLNEKFDTASFCNLVGISKNQFDSIITDIKTKNPAYKRNPQPFIKNIPRDQFAYIQEQISLYNAFEIIKRPERRYHVNSAGNILGYINEANQSYIKRDSNYYQPGDIVGISGVERSYEDTLRGVKGIRHVLKDNRSKTIGSYKNGNIDIPLESGKAVTLTIDYELQAYAEKLLQNKQGAVVALDPNNGEILVLASAPTINPNDYLNNQLRNEIIRDTIKRPSYDRAAQGSYPPGSTFKLINGLAALQMGTITDSTRFSCRKGFRYGGRRLRCHDWGTFDIVPAIQNSCNTYFCRIYAGAVDRDSLNINHGIDEWTRIVKSFGLGNYLNNDLAVGSPGRIPNSEYYNNSFGEGTWSPYTIISNGIGQGDVEATPLQMANYTAAIANRGYFYTPHIVKAINGEPITDPNFTERKQTLVDKKHFEPVIKGMQRVISRGTARKIRRVNFTQAGKTGTSQVTYGEDHSLFVLFAPVEDPKIAIAVVVENGHWGSNWAAPIASLVAEKYINDTIKSRSRRYLEHRMLKGSLEYQYDKNWINYLKRTGQYVEPPKVDSIGTDSLAQGN